MCFGCWSKREKTATACHGCCSRTCAPQTLHAQPTVRVAYAMRHTLNLSLRARASVRLRCSLRAQHASSYVSQCPCHDPHVPQIPNPTVMPGHVLHHGDDDAVGQVEALLDRIEGQPSAMQYIAERFEALGYMSWAYRIVNSSGAARRASAATARSQPSCFCFFLGVLVFTLGRSASSCYARGAWQTPQRRGVRAAQQQFFKVSAPETVPVSAAFGIPHRRRRFFLVASLYGDARDVLLSQARVRSSCACKTAVRMRDPGAMCSKDLAAALLPCCLRVDEAACCAPHAWVEPC